MDPIRLSICIATLDRARFLRETLESIFPQAGPEVELVVVDGGSSDETPVIVEEGKRRFPRLRSVRLDRPGGVDRDFDLAVSKARGEYCWLLPDDDLLKPGALSRILQGTRRPYSLIVANAEVRSADLAREIDPARLRFRGDRIYQPGELGKLLAETAAYLSYIGGVIIRRDLWVSREKEEYFGSEFAHVGVIFQAPLPSGVLVISDPLITIRYGNQQWSPRTFEIWMFKWPGLIWSFPHLAEAAKQAVVPREPWKRVRTLLRYRGAGVYGMQEYRQWIQPRDCAPWTKVMAVLVALMPGAHVNALARFYYSRIYSGFGGQLVDMQTSRYAPARGSKSGVRKGE